jgi:hypothetical protein
MAVVVSGKAIVGYTLPSFKSKFEDLNLVFLIGGEFDSRIGLSASVRLLSTAAPLFTRSPGLGGVNGLSFTCN